MNDSLPDRPGSAPTGSPLRDGALRGVAAWLAYGAAETLAGSVLPRLLKPDAGYRMLHHGDGLVTLVVYAAAGALLGAAAGAMAGRGGGTGAADGAPAARSLRLRALALAGLGAVFTLNLLAAFGPVPGGLPLAILAVAAVLTVVWTSAGVSEAAARRLALATHPAVGAAVLAGTPWIAKDLLGGAGDVARAAGAAGLVVAVLAVSAVLRRGHAARGAGRAAVFAAGAALLVTGAGALMNRVPSPPATASSSSEPSLPASAAGGRGTPVVLVILDTVRADHTSVYGYERDTTPRLRELAADATTYRRSVAAGDMTLSTHASLFTGLTARAHGAHHPDPHGAASTGPPGRLDDRFETLAERLRGMGYRTWGIAANHGYLGPFFRLDQGFDYWDTRPAAGWSSEKYTLRYAVRHRLLARAPVSRDERHRAFRSADEIHREVVALLDRAPADGRFLLFVNTMDAHFPYMPPPPFEAMFPGGNPDLDVPMLERSRRETLLKGKPVPAAEREHLIARYDGGVAYVDSRLGMLLDELRARGLYDDALIIVTSDHGEAFGERGLIDHGVSVYEDQVGVPLLIKYPGRRTGDVAAEPVGSVDILPTALAAVGAQVPADLPGRDLAGDAARRDPVVAEHYPFDALVRAREDFRDAERAIYDGETKLIRRDGGVELYDLEADPEELRNLSAERTDAQGRMAAGLGAWMDSTAASGGDTAELDAAVSEQLEALGYVQ